MSEAYEPRQIVRPMGKSEMLPPYLTADLFLMEIQPVYVPERKITKQIMPLAHQSKVNAKKSHDRFSPHIETIKRMRAEGETFTIIADAIGIARNTVSRYYDRNKGLFK